MKKTGNILLSLIITGIFISYSCGGRVPPAGFNPPSVDPSPTAPPSTEPTPPPVGSDVDIKFLQTFNPDFATGMKYTFILTGTGLTKPVEVSSEVLAVTADSITARVKSTDGSSKDKTMKVADFTNPTPEIPSDQVKFKFVGKEDIKVTAGTYKAATKVTSSTASGVFTGWYAAGTGMVKKTFVDPKKVNSILDLKEFKGK
jgi:hypothetical protein